MGWEERPLLFTFLEERRQLTADKDRPNWITTFTSSIDLKASLTKYYEEAFLPQRLAEAIYRNEFPLFDVTLDAEQMKNSFGVTGTVEAINHGTTTAFNMALYWDTEVEQKETIRYC